MTHTTRYAVAIVACFLFLGTFTLNAQAQSFSDVPESNQFYEAIEWGTESGIIKGYGDGRFGPKNILNGANFAVMFTRLVDGRLFYDNNNLTERQVAFSYLKSKRIPFNEAKQNAPFTRLDVAKIMYAYTYGEVGTEKEVIDFMYAHHITRGKGMSEDPYIDFAGGDQLRREHAVQFLLNFYHHIYEEEELLEQLGVAPLVSLEKMFGKDYYKYVDFNGDGIHELAGTIKSGKVGRYYVLIYSTDNGTHGELRDIVAIEGREPVLEVIDGLTENDTEQLAYFFTEGMVNNLYFWLITADDLEEVKVSEIAFYPYAQWRVENGRLVVYSSDSYSGYYGVEDGYLVEYPLTDIPPKAPDANRLTIQYDVRNDRIVSPYANGATISAKVGQYIDFVQGADDIFTEYVWVMYFDSDNIINEDGYFTKPGTFEVMLILDGNFDEGYSILIEVE